MMDFKKKAHKLAYGSCSCQPAHELYAQIGCGVTDAIEKALKEVADKFYEAGVRDSAALLDDNCEQCNENCYTQQVLSLLSKPEERCKHEVWKADHCYSCEEEK